VRSFIFFDMNNNPVNPPDYRHDTVLPLAPEVRANAWAVDAACSGNPGPMEYQGIDLQTGAQVFHYGPVQGTNNIGEFLAIVHALALLDKQGITDKTIYSDSRTAIIWVNKMQCKTKLPCTPDTQQLHQIIQRAEFWLRQHPQHAPVVHWQTKEWGEIPADFGRK
jgi:ribonuclease HI